MLNSFLQFLDEDSSGSMVIAATNHQELLDRAIFRRFDATIPYDLPSAEHVRRILVNRLPQFDMANIDWSRVEVEAAGLSQADIVASADDAARDAVMEENGLVDTMLLVRALADRKHPAL